MGFASCIRKAHTRTQYKVRTTGFLFISSVGVFLGIIVDWWVKYFRYIYCNTIRICIASIVVAVVWCTEQWTALLLVARTIMHGKWTYMHCKFLFELLHKSDKNSLKFLQFEWEFQMLGPQITGSLLYRVTLKRNRKC